MKNILEKDRIKIEKDSDDILNFLSKIEHLATCKV